MTQSTTTARALRDSLTGAVLVLVHSNLFISLAATSIAFSTVLLADLALDPLPLFIVFAVTLFVYSFNRLADRAEDEQNVPDRAEFIDKFGKPLFLLGLLLYLAATGIAILRSVPGAPAMVLPLAVAVLYSTLGLKRVLLVKNLLVGGAWGCIPLGVGVYYGQLLTMEVLFMAAFVTVMLTIAAVIFDIKDIEGDSEEGITTIPVLVGPARTRQLAVAATAVVGIALLTLIVSGLVPGQFLLATPFVLYVLAYCPFATEERSPLFYGFVVDGEHIFLAAFLAVVEFGFG